MSFKKGHRVSKEIRKKISLSKTGKPRPDLIGNDFCKNRKPWNKGIKYTDIGLKNTWNKGKKFPQNQREKNYNWKGGIWNNSNGYVYLLNPEHPKAKHTKGYVAEHVLVMEKHLGRYLKEGEVVHHINGNKHDNRIENLMLFKNISEHNKYHRKTEPLKYKHTLETKKKLSILHMGNKNPSWRGGLKTLICKKCNKKFKCGPGARRKFCSLKCYHLLKIKNKNG